MNFDLSANLNKMVKDLKGFNPVKVTGVVTRVLGLIMEGVGPLTAVGETCLVYPKEGGLTGVEPIESEVVGFANDKILLMPLGDVRGVGPGSKFVIKKKSVGAKVGEQLLGRVLDGLGEPLDRLGPLGYDAEYPLYAKPPNPLDRRRITEPLDVSIKTINGLLTVGKGQRIGIFAGSGVGKSVLLGMMAKGTEADVNVIALVGERGREVKEFIEKDLGAEGLKRSVVIVATSDQPPLIRMRAAFLATTIAEYFRDKEKNVLLVMDSLTRFATAQREVGLATGEPPATKGYPPSVFALLPRLLERAGNSASKGSITAFYTILAEGDDVNDPIADAVRAILDGHIILTRDLASQGHYPAIDVLSSISRVMIDVTSKEHRSAATYVRAVMATYKKAYDLISIGAYKQGSDSKIDRAIELNDKINAFLCQDIGEATSFEDTVDMLAAVAS
jgi:flagellum-specific ATP synthase